MSIIKTKSFDVTHQGETSVCVVAYKEVEGKIIIIRGHPHVSNEEFINIISAPVIKPKEKFINPVSKWKGRSIAWFIVVALLIQFIMRL